MSGGGKADLLDNPVWAALTTGNRALAGGGPLASRYPTDIAPFAAIANRTALGSRLAPVPRPSGQQGADSKEEIGG